jgi:2-iminobutanoate/2-iminopropanoate deaminase
MAEHTPMQPPALPPPAANYSHAILTTGAGRWLHTSGVVPTDPDGTVPPTLQGQLDRIWWTIAELVAAAGMQTTDIVSVTTYAVVGEDLGTIMRARDAAMAGHRPSSTLVTVPALVRPEWKVEIAVIAAA